MINYILLFVFIIINNISIFIFNLDNPEINGNLSILENFSNKNTMNINSFCNINCNNIEFENTFNINSSGNIIFDNVFEFNSPENNSLIGLNKDKNIINTSKSKNNSLEQTITVENINGLNNNSLTFKSTSNSIFIYSDDRSNLIINCNNLSLSNVFFTGNIIFNDTVNSNNKIILGDIFCNNLLINSGLVFIKSPINITSNICNIKNIEIKNTDFSNLIQGNITINSPINQIKSIFVNTINDPSNNLICLDNNNQIFQTQKIINFSLNTNTISNPNSIVINNLTNISATHKINFNTNTISLNTLNSTVLNLNHIISPLFNNLSINKLSTTNQGSIGRYISVLDSCSINLANKPITFLIDCNNYYLLKTILGPNSCFFNLKGISNYSYNLKVSRGDNNNRFIFKYLPTFSIKNKNSNIIKNILYKIYKITKEIKNNYQNIKNSIESYKKEYKKSKKYIAENEIISESMKLLLHNYSQIKEIVSINDRKEIEKILLQLSETESSL